MAVCSRRMYKEDVVSDEYPKTIGEAANKVLDFVRSIPEENLRDAILDFYDKVPLTRTLKRRLMSALQLLGREYGGPYPEAARDLLALSMKYAYMEGADLGKATNAFIDSYPRNDAERATYTQEDLERLLEKLIEGKEEE